ncbi:MAG: YjhG/YagF family D-xylonate dehydratase [Terriglobales bacterium]
MAAIPLDLLDSGDPSIYDLHSHAPGPTGSLPFAAEQLRSRPSGDLFGWSQNAGMGWAPGRMGQAEFLILSTQGGVRAPDGSPIALGYHSGHWEVGLLVQAAAEELQRLGTTPFAAFCSDPCDGRTQGTPGMMDSLAYRNDAALVLGRLIRSLPTRAGVLGIATCDKGLPAMLMAVAGARQLPGVVVPGGVMLAGEPGSEDTGKVQTIGVRFAHGVLDLEEAAELGCRACASPGGGCQFLGTAATSQVVAEALGLTVAHAALAPSGQPIWLDMARRSSRCLTALHRAGVTSSSILTSAAFENAMTVHAAFGGSTNLLLHVPAIAFAAGVTRPTVADWQHVNRATPRLVDALPNGPIGHPTVRVFLAGGVPEVMLHLRRLGLLNLQAQTVSGITLDAQLDWWEQSERRQRLRAHLRNRDGVDPDTVILSPLQAKERGLTSTVMFPVGNLAPEGSVVKSTAIDASLVGNDGIYRKLGPARIFNSESAAMAAIKSSGEDRIRSGDVLVLMGRGPLGAGMEEIYQLTSALRYLAGGKEVAVITDARFSGVSTGACLGHIGPEALAGGPLGKLREGDLIEIVLDRGKLSGTINFVGRPEKRLSPEAAAIVLAARPAHPDLAPDPRLPADTRLWALLQAASGGTWAGCVYDVERIATRLDAVSGNLPAADTV